MHLDSAEGRLDGVAGNPPIGGDDLGDLLHSERTGRLRWHALTDSCDSGALAGDRGRRKRG